MVHRYVILASAALLAACASDAGTSRSFAPSLDAQGPAEAILTGAGHSDLPISGDMRNFTFHVRRSADGTASGSYRLHRHDIDAWFTVNVTCMTVVGNTAWVAGLIDDTNLPNVIRVGTVSYFFAIDNGEGSGAVDRISRARINDAAGQDAAFCALQPRDLFDPNPISIVQGNVQLR